MLLAVWAPRPTAARALAENLPPSYDLETLHTANAVVGVRLPFVVRCEGDAIDAWPRGHEHPHVRIDGTTLTVVAGALPQLPLYRTTIGDIAVISSSLDVVRRLTSAPLVMRRVVSMATGLPDPWPGETIFRGVQRLTAGMTLVFGDGASSSATTTIPRCGTRFDGADRDASAGGLRNAIIEAIEARTRDAGRVGVLVGGGLDSSGLLALALECVDRTRVDAIAEVWQSPGEDRPFLEALEAFLHLRASRHSAREAAPWVLRSLCADAQPQLWPGASHDMMLWCAARDLGDEVVLGGYGGDIVLGGRPSFAGLLRRGHAIRAVRGALRLRVPWPMSPRARVRSWVLSPFISAIVPSQLHAHLVSRRLAAPWMRSTFREHLFAAVEASLPTVAPRNPDEWFVAIANDPVFSELAMSWGAMSIETRTAPYDIFRDTRVVSAIARVDPLARMDGDYHRGLFRRALRGYVPEVVRLRNDKAVMEPGIAESIVAASAVDEISDLGSLTALADHGLVDPAPFRPIFARWLASLELGERMYAHGADEWWRTIWQLLSVERFLRVVTGTA